ncbi:MAG: Flp pilus assembly complex ATPase component TadA [Anaerolineae bacterium]|nr:Flp pilus assembly complex ATPase component TadA [Anaerolineae bacterium]
MSFSLDQDPVLYPDKMGMRQYSLDSLREKIEEQFHAETAGRVDIFSELNTRAARLTYLHEIADYVLASEYVVLPMAEKNRVVGAAVDNLFYFGPLDPYLRDPQVTEIALEGPFDAHVRLGFGEMQRVAAPYSSFQNLEDQLMRLLAPAGASFLADYPFLEVGLSLHDRPVRVSLIGPPANTGYSVQFRLHPTPANALGLAALTPATVPAMAAELLHAGLAAGRGLLITGEVGVGKSTLLAALLNNLPAPGAALLVERAREATLNPNLATLPAEPPRMDGTHQDFAAQISEGAARSPRLLAIDEIRGDEGPALVDALEHPGIGQLMIALRGTANARRLLSAFTIALVRTRPDLDQATIYRLILEKMPLVAVLGRPAGARTLA